MADFSDIAVIGGGLIGLATAVALAEQDTGLRITVLEAESGLARHQSGRNSGVLHSGVYYQPGSQKAALCIEGRRRMNTFCERYDIPIEHTGKVIVATSESELEALNDLAERGRANGLTDLELVDPAGLREHEPYAVGMRALFVPEAGIVDFTGVAERLAALLRASGHTIRTGFHVADIAPTATGFRFTSRTGESHNSGYLINCAGLHSDRIAAMAGVKPPVRIVPFRGEYYVLAAEQAFRVQHLVYPVPDPRFPFLGVHFTRRIDGSVEVGPNAVVALGRHQYRGEGGFDTQEVKELVTAPEIWRLAAKYWLTGTREIIRSRSRRLYAAAARQLIPGVRAEDLHRGGSGIRAQAVTPDGTLVDDFVIEEADHAMHVLNAPSPAATASLAIGDRIAGRVVAALS